MNIPQQPSVRINWKKTTWNMALKWWFMVARAPIWLWDDVCLKTLPLGFVYLRFASTCIVGSSTGYRPDQSIPKALNLYSLGRNRSWIRIRAEFGDCLLQKNKSKHQPDSTKTPPKPQDPTIALRLIKTGLCASIWTLIGSLTLCGVVPESSQGSLGWKWISGLWTLITPFILYKTTHFLG